MTSSKWSVKCLVHDNIDCAMSKMRKIERLLVFSLLVFSGEDDVFGSHISVLDPKPVKNKGRPRVNTRIKSRINLQLLVKSKRI